MGVFEKCCIKHCKISSKTDQHSFFNHMRFHKNFLPTFFLAYSLRDTLHSNIAVGNNPYAHVLFSFLALGEGCKLYPYLDTRNHWHLGYGLLLKRDDAHEYEQLAVESFKKALGVDLYKLIPVEKLNPQTAKQFNITKEDAKQLLLYSLSKNEEKISKILPRYFQLSPNIKIALQSLYYNAPCLLGPNLLKHINLYLDTNDSTHLLNVIKEIEEYSNPKTSHDWAGIQNRRYMEGAMCSNPMLDLFIRIDSSLFFKFLYELQNPVNDIKQGKFIFSAIDAFVFVNIGYRLEQIIRDESLHEVAYEKIRHAICTNKIFSTEKVTIQHIWKILEKLIK